MLTFILGPSGSGKSRRMLAELRTRAENGQRSLLIVPEQFTSSTEGTLYHILGDSLSAYVESYSFTSLAEALLRRYGGAAVETLSEAGPPWGGQPAGQSRLLQPPAPQRRFLRESRPDHRGTEKCRHHPRPAGRLCPPAGG